MSFLFAAGIILGIISLLYYCVIIAYAGIGASFAWFWLLLSIGCLLFCFTLRFMLKYDIRVPSFIKIFFFTVITIGICIFLFVEGTILIYSNQKADSGVDYLIVLGAQVRGTRISKVLQRRLDTASDYLVNNPSTIVIVSGGQGTGEDLSEAEAMKRYLVKKGISVERILKEDQSTNTDQNIRYSKKLITENHASIAIVTNGFHVFRALSIAKKQNLTEVQGLAAPTDYILFINYYVREAAGVLKDKLFGNL